MQLDHIDRSKEIYTKAFETYGDDTRSCLWDKPMIMRYHKLQEIIPESLNGKSILDIGCGIGGFYEYLTNNCNIENINYLGIDIVEGMLELSRKKYPKAVFENINLLEEPLYQTFDYVFICGVFNVNAGENNIFMQELLKKAFEYCNCGVAFNFISNYVNFKQEEMVYYEPEEVFRFCAENITRKINMFHHYAKCDVAVLLQKE